MTTFSPCAACGASTDSREARAMSIDYSGHLHIHDRQLSSLGDAFDESVYAHRKHRARTCSNGCAIRLTARYLERGNFAAPEANTSAEAQAAAGDDYQPLT